MDDTVPFLAQYMDLVFQIGNSLILADDHLPIQLTGILDHLFPMIFLRGVSRVGGGIRKMKNWLFVTQELHRSYIKNGSYFLQTLGRYFCLVIFDAGIGILGN